MNKTKYHNLTLKNGKLKVGSNLTLKHISRKWQSYWMGATLKVAPPEMAPRRHVRRRTVAAAFLHYSPPCDRPSTRIWSKLAKKWQSYWMGAIWGWRRRKWRRSAAYGAVALRRRCYTIPHPTIYLLPEFAANWPKKELLKGRHFEGGAAGNGNAAPHTAA